MKGIIFEVILTVTGTFLAIQCNLESLYSVGVLFTIASISQTEFSR